MNTNNLTQMNDHNVGNYGTTGIAMIFSFTLAFLNNIFGFEWLAQIRFHSELWDKCLQSAILGIIGATVTYITNKIFKAIDKRLNKHKQKKHETKEESDLV
jgi:hypothetical protein